MSTSGIDAQRTAEPATAWQLVEHDGAAVLSATEREAGESWTDYGVRRAREVFGKHGVQVVAQFEASVASGARGDVERSRRPADDPFLKRINTVTPADDLWLHNDGYAVADQAPDTLFLLCQQPAREGGANVLIDTRALLAEIAVDDPELARFLFDVPVDQSEPAFDEVHEPVARVLAGGRVQVRRNPYQTPLPGSPARHAELLARWQERCEEAAASAPGILLAQGDLACFDNYRVLHGRRPYVGDERTAHSIWGWSTAALAVLPIERELVF